VSEKITDITWAISWESRTLSAAISVRDREQVSRHINKIKKLLDDLDAALEQSEQIERSTAKIYRLHQPSGGR